MADKKFFTDTPVFCTIAYQGNAWTISNEMVVNKDGTTVTGSVSGYGNILDSNHESNSKLEGIPVIDLSDMNLEDVFEIINAPDSVRPSEISKFYTGTLETWLEFCENAGAKIIWSK